MRDLEQIANRAKSRGLPCLLCGGHAVIVHGHARTTFDIDLLIQRSARTPWISLLNELRYQIFHEGPSFLQFTGTGDTVFPVDLMFVSDGTFSKMTAEAATLRLGGSDIAVVSLIHLLALKCHAVRHGHPGRILKDADDLIQLIQINRLDVDAPHVRELILKHGTGELYDKLRKVCGPD